MITLIIPEHGTGMIYGPPNVGKSLIAEHLAMCIARGTPWHGRPVVKCAVLYVAAEGGHGFRVRVSAYAKHYGADVNTAPFGLSDECVDLRTGQVDTDRVITACHALKVRTGRGVGLVVLDTLSRVLAGGDENSPVDIGMVLAAARKISDATGGFVLFVHHPGKDAGKGARGHSSLLGNVDTMIKVEMSPGLQKQGSVKLDKQRDGPTDVSEQYGIQQIDLGKDADSGQPITSAVAIEISSGFFGFDDEDGDSMEAPDSPKSPKLTEWQKNVLMAFAKVRGQTHQWPLPDELTPAYEQIATDAKMPLVKNWKKMFNRAVRELRSTLVLAARSDGKGAADRLCLHGLRAEDFNATVGVELWNPP